jgi:hypothetical protein
MAMTKTKRKRPAAQRGQRVSIADQLRLGPDAAAVKAKTSPRDWSAIVKNAHAKGFTVAGAVSGVPDPLKERTRSSLVDEAQKTAATAFGPANVELTQQESKTRALDAKRQADEAHFQTWLAGKQQSMAAAALSADNELAQRQQAIQQQTQTGYQQAQATAQTNAAATPGNVSDPHMSTALNLAPDAQRANDLVAAQRQQSASMANSAQGYAIAGQGVSNALGQQAETTRQQETAAALSDLSLKRQDVLAKQAAAASDEIQRLFGVETNKADSNRNYLAAANKLGIDQQALQQKADQFTATQRLGAAKLKTSVSIANARNQTQRDIADAKTKIDFKKLQASQGNAAANRALKRELARIKNTKSTSPSPGEKTASAKVYNKLNAIVSDIQRLQKKAPSRPIRDIVTSKGASKVEYELALDVAVNGKLSKLNQSRAKSLGLIVPPEWR